MCNKSFGSELFLNLSKPLGRVILACKFILVDVSWFLSLVKDNKNLFIGQILVRLKSENSWKLQRTLSVKLIPANPNWLFKRFTNLKLAVSVCLLWSNKLDNRSWLRKVLINLIELITIRIDETKLTIHFWICKFKLVCFCKVREVWRNQIS